LIENPIAITERRALIATTFAWSALALPANAGKTLLVDEWTIVEQVAAVVILVVRKPLAAVDELRFKDYSKTALSNTIATSHMWSSVH